jgi:7,8-dihydropterin-6-yl-methyl-4-(beta-D-ribofuranosyl)aminobenzene 5'-phosphate synthase
MDLKVWVKMPVSLMGYAVSVKTFERSILGGTRLEFLTAEQFEETIKSLKKMKIEKIGVSHCTGMRAALRFNQEFDNRFFYGCVGSVLEV